MDWFRSWHGAPRDSKWLLVGMKAKVPPGIVAALAWDLMDHASKNNNRGSIQGFDAEEYCAFTQFDLKQVTAALAALTEGAKPFIDRKTMTLTAWMNRNPKTEDPAAAERKRLQRERDKVAVTGGHGQSHDVTTDQTRPDQIRPESKRPKTVPVTARGSGSFRVAGSGVGSGQGFDIRHHLKDDDYLLFRTYCPLWDKDVVCEKYNAYVAGDPPKKPVKGFTGWLDSNKRWLSKPP